MAEPSSSLTKCLAVQWHRPVDADLVQASRTIDQAPVQQQHWLTSCDVLVTPTTPQRVLAFAEAAPASQADFAGYANFAGKPALSVPTSVAEGELPLGLQLISRVSDERRLIALADAFQQATRWSPQVPSACYSWWSR